VRRSPPLRRRLSPRRSGQASSMEAVKTSPAPVERPRSSHPSLAEARAEGEGRGRCRRRHGGWASAARNGSTRATCYSTGMPRPVSLTERNSWRPSNACRPTVSDTVTSPGAGEAHGVASRLTSSCRIRVGSPSRLSGSVRDRWRPARVPWAAAAGATRRRPVMQHAGLEPARSPIEAPASSLRGRGRRSRCRAEAHHRTGSPRRTRPVGTWACLPRRGGHPMTPLMGCGSRG